MILVQMLQNQVLEKVSCSENFPKLYYMKRIKNLTQVFEIEIVGGTTNLW